MSVSNTDFSYNWSSEWKALAQNGKLQFPDNVTVLLC